MPDLNRRGRIARYLVVAGISMLGPISVDMYLPALPSMAEAFAAPDPVIQLTITAFLIGMATGQLVVGPLSDAVGRRPPLLVGLGCYVAASLLCTLTASAPALIGLRFVQGMAGSAGLVIALATVRDIYAGRQAARFMSYVQMFTVLGPLLAPLIGGQVLRVSDWTGIFVAQAIVGLVLVTGAAVALRETHPPELRRPARFGAALASLRDVARDAEFLSYALPAGLVTGAAFTYIASSSFVLHGTYGVSPQTFSAIFAINAMSLVLATQANGLLLRWVAPERLLRFGLAAIATGPLVLVAIATATDFGLAGVVPALSLCLIGFGFTNANAAALALTPHPRSAGAAAALVGILRFSVGAVSSPLAGLAGGGTPVGLGLQMFGFAVAASAVHLLLRRRVDQREIDVVRSTA